jgi:hypothetical protein
MKKLKELKGVNNVFAGALNVLDKIINFLKDDGYYAFGEDNTPACYLTNLLIGITNYYILKNIGTMNGTYVDLFKLGISSDLKPNYLWVSIIMMNDFSRNIILSSVIKNRYGGNQIYYMITCIIISLLNGYNSHHFDGIIDDKINAVLNINKYWIHIVNDYILKNKYITTVGIFGLIHETGYIGYRLKFDKCNQNYDYNGILPKQFNHNAIYHINWAIYNYILFKAYKS